MGSVWAEAVEKTVSFMLSDSLSMSTVLGHGRAESFGWRVGCKYSYSVRSLGTVIYGYCHEFSSRGSFFIGNHKERSSRAIDGNPP